MCNFIYIINITRIKEECVKIESRNNYFISVKINKATVNLNIRHLSRRHHRLRLPRRPSRHLRPVQ